MTERVSVSIDWVVTKLVENHARACQAVEVIDKQGNPIGEFKYDGNVANRALELLGKHLGAFVERFHHTIEDQTGVLQITPEKSTQEWEEAHGVPVAPEPEPEQPTGNVN
jgi:phage terminase small subunit